MKGNAGYAVGDNGVILKTITGGSQSLATYKSGENKLGIFPNPNQGSFTVSLSNTNQSVQLVISDIMGKIIFNSRVTGDSWSFKDFPLLPGIYLVAAGTADHTFTGKMVVQ